MHRLDPGLMQFHPPACDFERHELNTLRALQRVENIGPNSASTQENSLAMEHIASFGNVSPPRYGAVRVTSTVYLLSSIGYPNAAMSRIDQRASLFADRDQPANDLGSINKPGKVIA